MRLEVDRKCIDEPAEHSKSNQRAYETAFCSTTGGDLVRRRINKQQFTREMLKSLCLMLRSMIPQRSSSEEEVSSAVDLLEEMSYRLYRKLTDPKDELGDEVDGVSETDSKDREVFIDASRDFALHLYLNHEEVEEYDVWRIIPRPPHTLDFSPAVVASALAQRKKMMYSHGLFAFVFVFVCWRAVKTQESPDEVQRGSNENHLAAERMMRYTPDMRLVLNGLLRYENAISKKPEESLPYPFFHLTNRSIKGSLPPVDDPLAVLATGFMGSRGKRDDYDEIPVFANGFPAGRG
ncbi:uncharacterized protein LOC129988622 [Argiope bruennichi]|uniref:uncharacterized protein LOC129988622 n=1 Tax=Argiope bruennichi TaxID=94029 RepID=UPI0024959CA7|nr:uncharacterized protein LOC129988622 [Argiope bruennichi]